MAGPSESGAGSATGTVFLGPARIVLWPRLTTARPRQQYGSMTAVFVSGR